MTTSMPPDSAWRQLRRAHDTVDKAGDALHAARNVWLITLFEEFGARYAKAEELGHDTANLDTLIALGIPCINCLGPAPARSGHEIVIGTRDKQWPVYAFCGKAYPDPREIDAMPTLPASPMLTTADRPL